MNHVYWKQCWAAVVKVLSLLYWSTAACLVLGGASCALLLVATFLFPFLPFIGALFVAQAAGYFVPRKSRLQEPAQTESALPLRPSQSPSSV